MTPTYDLSRLLPPYEDPDAQGLADWDRWTDDAWQQERDAELETYLAARSPHSRAAEAHLRGQRFWRGVYRVWGWVWGWVFPGSNGRE